MAVRLCVVLCGGCRSGVEMSGVQCPVQYHYKLEPYHCWEMIAVGLTGCRMVIDDVYLCADGVCDVCYIVCILCMFLVWTGAWVWVVAVWPFWWCFVTFSVRKDPLLGG